MCNQHCTCRTQTTADQGRSNSTVSHCRHRCAANAVLRFFPRHRFQSRTRSLFAAFAGTVCVHHSHFTSILGELHRPRHRITRRPELQADTSSWKMQNVHIRQHLEDRSHARLRLPACSTGRRPTPIYLFSIANLGTCESFFFRSNRISNRIGHPIRFRIESSNRIGRITQAVTQPGGLQAYRTGL